MQGFEAVLLATTAAALVSAVAGAMLFIVDRKYSDYLEEGEAEGGSAILACINLSELGSVFWVLNLATFAVYLSVLPFISFSNEFIMSKWKVTATEAGWMTGTHTRKEMETFLLFPPSPSPFPVLVSLSFVLLLHKKRNTLFVKVLFFVPFLFCPFSFPFFPLSFISPFSFFCKYGNHLFTQPV